MWALVSGRSYTDFQYTTGPIVNWATRLMGNATPVVLDILLLALLTGVALLIVNHRYPARKLARLHKRDLTRRR
jgi:hypothetical protein